MLISELSIKGYKSYGNNEQILKLNTEKGELILLVGNNGNGKSVVKETEITIDIPIESFNLKELNLFLEIMDMESDFIIEYIRVNNYSLYEQYINQ